MSASLVAALVQNDDSLEVVWELIFLLPFYRNARRTLIAINIVMPSLQGLLHSNGNSKSDILSPARVFSSVQHFRLELVWHCYCQDRVGGL